MSLDTGYYIEGRLEIFSKEQYFDKLLGIQNVYIHLFTGSTYSFNKDFKEKSDGFSLDLKYDDTVSVEPELYMGNILYYQI